MSLPSDVSLVTVTGTYLTDDGTPAAGSITFTPSVSTLSDPTYDKIIKLRQTRVDLDDAGAFSISMISTDDADLSPVGWHYDVSERIDGHPQRVWILQLPSALTTIDISDAPTVVNPSRPTYPSPVYAVSSVVGKTGDVTGADIVSDPTVESAFASATDLAGYVPYTGATTDVDLGDNQLSAANVNYTEGTLSDPTVTDNGDLTISVSAIECCMRDDDESGDQLYRVTVPADPALPITDDDTNHLYVDWNGGSPVYAVTTDRSVLSLTHLPVGRIHTSDGVVRAFLPFGLSGRSTAARHLFRTAQLNQPVGAIWESGLGLAETPTRVITVGSGFVWFVLNRITLDSLTMGDSGVTALLLYHSSGEWTSTEVTQYDNQHYDNGTDLVDTSNNKYVVNWIYRSLVDATILIVLGGGDYTAAEAQESSAPTPPVGTEEFCVLVGRVIVEEDSDTAFSIEDTTSSSFGTTVLAHNDLSSLQGGAIGEYYHLTADEYSGIGTGYVPYTGATTDVDLGDNQLSAANVNYTEGTLSDPTITDATGSAVNVGECDVIIRSGDDWTGGLYRRTVPAAEVAVTDDAVNYICVQWGGGTPTYVSTTNRETITWSDVIPVARVSMEAGAIEHQLPYGNLANGAAARNLYRVHNIRGTGGVERESGLTLGESSLAVTVGAGYAWHGVDRVQLDSITNGVDGAVMNLCYHSGGAWTETAVSTCENGYYDNGTDLVALTSGRYAVNWVFRNLVENEIDLVLGKGDYTLAQAEASEIPPVPPDVDAFYALAGRIIVRKGASSSTVVQTVANTTFAQAAVSDHEELSGLQGGTTGEHYHLTSAQHSAYGTATAIAAGTPASSSAAGTPGQVLYDEDYLYICVATDTWKRVAISTF